MRIAALALAGFLVFGMTACNDSGYAEENVEYCSMSEAKSPGGGTSSGGSRGGSSSGGSRSSSGGSKSSSGSKSGSKSSTKTKTVKPKNKSGHGPVIVIEGDDEFDSDGSC